jgi:outer membrane protein assembly factor BamB
MKKTSFTLFMVLVLSVNITSAFAAFKQLHSVKLSFTPSTHNYSHTDDFSYFLCSNKSDMAMVDGLNGKVLWSINFAKDLSNKRFSNQHWNKYANVILVYDEDTKKEVAKKYFIDGETGKMLWESNSYVSDYGKYELKDGFTNYFDYETNGVLLPTKNSVDFVDVNTGKTLWSKTFDLSGKARDFDCFIMKYYDLVKIITGKETEIYLSTLTGEEVTDINPYYNKKKALADKRFVHMVEVPEKNMYVTMQGETSNFYAFLGASLPKWKMTFIAYDLKTDQQLWNKKYMVAHAFDWLSYEPFLRMSYGNGKIFVQHDPNLNTKSGLTVIDVDNGEKIWEANYSTSEMKSSGLTKTYLTPYPAPEPLVVGNTVFVVDKVYNHVGCFDINSGKKIWESPKFPDAQKIPTLVYFDGVLVMAFGQPTAKTAKIIQSSGPTIYRREFNGKDKYGIIAYDATTGKTLWFGDKLAKKTKDKFEYIAGTELVNGKLLCATNKNFFIIDPKSGEVEGSLPVSKEKVGAIWKMNYFAEKEKVVLDCEKGVVKIDPVGLKIEGSVKTPNITYFSPVGSMNADNHYDDYAIFTSGKPSKMQMKTFASIDLDAMKIRGTESAALLFYDNPHFSYGAEMFYKSSGSTLTIYSVK